MFYKKLIYDFIDKNKTYVISYSVLILITFPISSLILPQFYSKLFTNIEKNYKSLPKLGENIYKNMKKMNANGLIFIIIGLWLINIIFMLLKNSIESKMIPEYLSYVRQLLFSKIIENNSSNFEEIKNGEIITRILEVSRHMKDAMAGLIETLIPNLLAVFIIIGYFIYLNKSLGFITLFGFLILCLMLYLLSKRIILLSSKREKYYLMMSEKFNDSFNNLMNIYINNENNNEIEKNKNIDKIHTDTLKKQFRLTNYITVFLYIFIFIIFALILICSYKYVRNKTLSIEKFVSITFILIYFIHYLQIITDYVPYLLLKLGIIHNSIPFFEHILRDTEEENEHNINFDGNIEFKNINFKYPKSDNYVLNNFNLNVESHKKYGILGNSGSGKTTLMKLFIGMYPINEDGDILIDNQSIKHLNKNIVRQNIIYINQRTTLFNTAVTENILYGNENLYSKKDIVDILNKYDLNIVFSKLEYGINTNAGVNGTNLSLGMQKVVIILRGILKQSKIIIFDEPLAGLDGNTRVKIMKLIKDYCENKTVIIITHDKEIIPYCDEIVDMNKINRKA